MQDVTQTFRAAQYTGTAESAADVLATVTSTVQSDSVWSLAGADEQGMTLHEVNPEFYGAAGSDWFLAAGSWFVVAVGSIIDCLDDASFSAKWRTI